ncbi:MAG: paraquat-inducible protein A [Odoribacteraceae bacterium]|jgi:uncharacterized paraquat-inducible protein A|nr:paraquat-inducible protein A [Odoribacteraceae bacterium]
MTRETKKTLGLFAFALSVAFFALGMYFPLLSTHKQIVFKFGYEEITVFDSVQLFFTEREYFLAIVILLFTFIIPVLKYVELTIRISRGKTSKTLQNLDKWNMLDVFLVALLLVNFKIQSNIMVMQLKIGTTFIALAVIFRILTITCIANDNKPKNHNENGCCCDDRVETFQ